MITKRDFLTSMAAFSAGAAPVLSQTAPPVPKWEPTFHPTISDTARAFRALFGEKWHLVVFENTTCCAVPSETAEADIPQAASDILNRIVSFHPDFNVQQVTTGEVLVTYNQPACNIVPPDLAMRYADEIAARHLDGLVRDEVLITPQGQNRFDDTARLGLLGRAWMFMDALSLNAVLIDPAKI